jgi:hypothetical protein
VNRRLVRLVVPSPDRRRVLARPNGLAGWALPVVPLSADGWDEAALASAARVVGAPVQPVRDLGAGGWEVEVQGRVPAAGVTWIAPAEAARLGADADLARRWAADEG